MIKFALSEIRELQMARDQAEQHKTKCFPRVVKYQVQNQESQLFMAEY